MTPCNAQYASRRIAFKALVLLTDMFNRVSTLPPLFPVITNANVPPLFAPSPSTVSTAISAAPAQGSTPQLDQPNTLGSDLRTGWITCPQLPSAH
ncbi:hypothetical protein FRC12_012084 [Ceratobasidium sp. 428]|nr:hypothetical protein FRC12_012084 [Ceratobasidium sp. 428]